MTPRIKQVIVNFKRMLSAAVSANCGATTAESKTLASEEVIERAPESLERSTGSCVIEADNEPYGMLTKEYANWKRASSRKIQAIAAAPVSPAGVLNSKTKTMAKGVEPKSIQGRRRPHLVWKRSTVCPAMRSAAPAQILVIP